MEDGGPSMDQGEAGLDVIPSHLGRWEHVCCGMNMDMNRRIL